MSTLNGGPGIVKNGLILYLDAGNTKSYPGSGLTWSDITSNISATLTNGPSFSNTNNGSIGFDGIDDYVGILYTSILAPISAISFGCVAYLANWNSAANMRLISKTQTGGYHIGFNDPLYTGYLGGLVYAGGTYRVAKYSLSTISSGWHHIMYTFDGRYFRMYLDGVNVDTSDVGSNVTISYSVNNSLLIGAEVGAGSTSDGNYFNGKISLVKLYNISLTSADVLQNYNALKSRFNY